MLFSEVFPKGKPIIGMLHHKGEGRADIHRRAIAEARLMANLGVDSLMAEDYYGDRLDVQATLKWLQAEMPGYPYGVNVLDDLEASCELAEKHSAKLVQVDSIAGHLPPDKDEAYEKQALGWHGRGSFLLLGGVRFKYQPVASGRSLEEDLAIGMQRCDAIVVTGQATGIETDLAKIEEFRRIIGGFPLIVGAGITPGNIVEQLGTADGAIVGSTFKEGGKASGEILAERVKALMDKAKALQA